jgi:hypothetical protein
MNEADAEQFGFLRIGEGLDFVVYGDGAAGSREQPRQHVHQRGFSCAVLAHQGVDLTGSQRQIDVFKHLIGTE